MNTSNSGNDPQEDEDEQYDWENDRVCSYPCHVCGEEDDWEDDDE